MTTQSTADTPPQRPGGVYLWVIGVITLGLSLAIAFDVTPWLRGPSGPFEWRWHFRPSVAPVRLILVGLALFLLGGWYALTRRVQHIKLSLLLLLVPIGLTIQFSLLSTHANGLQVVSRMLNPAYFGYYPPATQIENIPDFLDTYADQQATFEHPRLQTHPPGNVVLYRVILDTTRLVPFVSDLVEPIIAPRIDLLPDWIDDYDVQEIAGGMAASVVVPLLATLTVIPLFLLLRTALDEQTARRGAVFYVLMPALTLFAPKIDTLYTALCLSALLTLYLGLRREQRWLIFVSGVLCSIGLFMSYSLALLCFAEGLTLIGYRVALWRRGDHDVRPLIIDTALLVGGGISIQALTALFYGYEPLRAYMVMRDRSAGYNMGLSYGWSLIYTPYDLLLFAGLPVSILAMGGLSQRLGHLRQQASISLFGWMLICVLIAVVLLVLSGIQRAENARILLYVMPVIVLGGTAELQRRQASERVFATLCILTIIQLIIFQTSLEVFV